MKKLPEQIQIITHYNKNDEDFSGDYTSVHIDIDNKVVAEFGDSYHDKGIKKAEGFINGLEWAFDVKFIVEYVEKNDYEG